MGSNLDLSRYKAVFFDVGGTLLRVHPSVGGVYARHARSFGFSGSEEKLDEQFRLQWNRSGGLESLRNKSGAEAEKTFWRDLVFSVFEPFGGVRDFEKYFEHIYKVFKEKESWRVFEDVTQSALFDRLRERGVVLGVISNWDSRLHEILKNTGLSGHFKFILASAEIGSAKPDRKIFEEALRRSGALPEEACHIGDEVETDIQGAKGVGMDAILVDRKGLQNHNDCLKVRSFMELV